MTVEETHVQNSLVSESASSPLVSVVIPVYNTANQIGFCLDSLLSQTYTEFEIVCVNDCSTDDSAVVLDLYRALDNRIVIMNLERNSGASIARNHGVQQASGELVTFVDGDDCVSPYYLSSLLAAYKFGGEGCFVKAKNLRGTRNAIGAVDWEEPDEADMRVLSAHEAMREFLLERLSEVAWACMAPRSWYIDHPFPPRMIFEDHYLMIDWFSSASRFVVIEKPVYGYVRQDVSLSNPIKHDIRFPRDMHAVVLHLLDSSRCWDESLQAVVPWAAGWRLALAVSYSYDIVDKTQVADICSFATAYLRRHLRFIVTVWKKESLDNGQFGKILFAAASPRLYWRFRLVFRRLTKADQRP